MDNRRISVGIVGTSWWADAMYLPALQNHPGAMVTAVCGRNLERAEAFAQQWEIPYVYNDADELIDSGHIDAVIIATSNDSHYPIGMNALQHGLHVLCEKPLALTYAQAAEMAALAQRKGVVTMTPFTYRYMPTARYLKELIDDGYIGRPYHLNMRYYTGYGRSGDQYNWRFDVGKAGSGALGDIASHFIYLAVWYFGEVVGVSCRLGHMVKRPLLDPDGQPYEVGDDTAVLILDFANGAQGIIHATTLAYEDTPFGQTHHMEFHGSGGTLYSFIDWDTVQQVSGARQGEGAVQPLPIPDYIWGNVRRDKVHHTYQDIFRENDFMTRGFVQAILQEKSIQPDFQDGAIVQKIIEAALQSHHQRRWVALSEIGS
jgi:predicted dehydrogenase